MTGLAYEAGQSLGRVDGFKSRDAEVEQLQKRLESMKQAEWHATLWRRKTEAERDVALEQVRALVEVLKRVVPEPFHCSDCGYFVGSDEDMCCTSCGADLEIVDFETAIAKINQS